MLLLVESAAGHRLAAAPMWRNLWVSRMITKGKAAAGWSWAMDRQEPLVRDVRGSAQLARRARPRRRGLSASWAAHIAGLCSTCVV